MEDGAGLGWFALASFPGLREFEGPGEGRPGTHARNYCVREQWACTQNVIINCSPV